MDNKNIQQQTAAEKQQAYFDAQRRLLDEERAEVEKMRLEVCRIQAVSDVGLEPGFAEFINGADEYEIYCNAREFRALISKIIEREVAKRVEQRLRAANIQRVTITSNVNPFAKETYNMTAQAKLFRENPVYARQLAAAAGVKL